MMARYYRRKRLSALIVCVDSWIIFSFPFQACESVTERGQADTAGGGGATAAGGGDAGRTVTAFAGPDTVPLS